MTIIFLHIYEKLYKIMSVIVNKNFNKLLMGSIKIPVMIYLLKISSFNLQKKIKY